jgi:hypothetical protein
MWLYAQRAAAAGGEAQAAAVRQAVQQRAKELATNYMDKQRQLLDKLLPAETVRNRCKL